MGLFDDFDLSSLLDSFGPSTSPLPGLGGDTGGGNFSDFLNGGGGGGGGVDFSSLLNDFFNGGGGGALPGLGGAGLFPGQTPTSGSALPGLGGFNPWSVVTNSPNTQDFSNWQSQLESNAGLPHGTNPMQQQSPDLLTSLGSKALMGLPIVGAGAGLAGIIQNLMAGRPQTTLKQATTTTPQEQQLITQTLQALHQLQGQAANQELQNAVKQLASGQLPISPDLVKQVTAAFGGAAGNLAQGSVENARQRGFAGGLDLLGGAASPQYSQSMAQLQSDVSQALVNLALGLPVTASNINAQQVNAQAQPIQLSNSLLQALNSANTRTTQQLGPQPNLLSTIQPFADILGKTGQFVYGVNALSKQNGGSQQQQYPWAQTSLYGNPASSRSITGS